MLYTHYTFVMTLFGDGGYVRRSFRCGEKQLRCWYAYTPVRVCRENTSWIKINLLIYIFLHKRRLYSCVYVYTQGIPQAYKFYIANITRKTCEIIISSRDDHCMHI